MGVQEILYHLSNSKTDHEAAAQLFEVLFNRLNSLENQYKNVDNHQAEKFEELINNAKLAVGFKGYDAEFSSLKTNEIVQYDGIRFSPLLNWYSSNLKLIKQATSRDFSHDTRFWLGIDRNESVGSMEVPLFLKVEWADGYPKPDESWMDAISFWVGDKQIAFNRMTQPLFPRYFGGHKSFWSSLSARAYKKYRPNIFLLQIDAENTPGSPPDEAMVINGSEQEELSNLLWLEVRLPAGISLEKGQLKFKLDPILLSNYSQLTTEKTLEQHEIGKELYLALESESGSDKFVSLNRVWGKKDYREVTWQQWHEVKQGYFQYYSTEHPSGNSIDARIRELQETSEALNVKLNCFLNEYGSKYKNPNNFPEQELVSYFRGFENDRNTLREKEVSHWVRVKPMLEDVLRVEWVQELVPTTATSQEVTLDHLIHLI